MENIVCVNCGKQNPVREVFKGLTLSCDCGCIQKCLGVDELDSRWRVINPFDFEDKRTGVKV